MISELRKGGRCDAGVAAWRSTVTDEDVFVSVLTIGEIRRGIERVRRRDPSSAPVLERWLTGVIEEHRDRVLIIDRRIAEEWGRLSVPDPLPVADGLLAATAKVHRLTLVTRNTRDIARTGVAFVDPWGAPGRRR